MPMAGMQAGARACRDGGADSGIGGARQHHPAVRMEARRSGRPAARRGPGETNDGQQLGAAGRHDPALASVAVNNASSISREGGDRIVIGHHPLPCPAASLRQVRRSSQHRNRSLRQAHPDRPPAPARRHRAAQQPCTQPPWSVPITGTQAHRLGATMGPTSGEVLALTRMSHRRMSTAVRRDRGRRPGRRSGPPPVATGCSAWSSSPWKALPRSHHTSGGFRQRLQQEFGGLPA